MTNNNPNNMSNDELEKDAQENIVDNAKGSGKSTNKSTAAEGDLITPEQDPHPIEDGSLPDSEELSLEEDEDGYDDPDKLSS